ncbi:MAG TPA: hypothetical protein VMT03_19675 [Polyangia bacterium]|nr:hypothetical protein [Polyangia bacterium]
MTISANETAEVPAVLHLRTGPGSPVACGGPEGLWTRDPSQVTCASCHAAQAVTRPIPVEENRGQRRRGREQ